MGRVIPQVLPLQGLSKTEKEGHVMDLLIQLEKFLLFFADKEIDDVEKGE
jgi:hypothetical protein